MSRLFLVIVGVLLMGWANPASAAVCVSHTIMDGKTVVGPFTTIIPEAEVADYQVRGFQIAPCPATDMSAQIADMCNMKVLTDRVSQAHMEDGIGVKFDKLCASARLATSMKTNVSKPASKPKKEYCSRLECLTQYARAKKK